MTFISIVNITEYESDLSEMCMRYYTYQIFELIIYIVQIVQNW